MAKARTMSFTLTQSVGGICYDGEVCYCGLKVILHNRAEEAYNPNGSKSVRGRKIVGSNLFLIALPIAHFLRDELRTAKQSPLSYRAHGRLIWQG